MDLQPESTAGGRGMYTGRIFGRDGMLAAGIAQESLFRARPPVPWRSRVIDVRLVISTLIARWRARKC